MIKQWDSASFILASTYHFWFPFSSTEVNRFIHVQQVTHCYERCLSRYYFPIRTKHFLQTDGSFNPLKSTTPTMQIVITGDPNYVLNSIFVDRLAFGVIIFDPEWFISEPKLFWQRHTDSSLSRPSASRMQEPAVFIVDQIKRKQWAEVSMHKLFFCSRQKNLHTQTTKKNRRPQIASL